MIYSDKTTSYVSYAVTSKAATVQLPYIFLNLKQMQYPISVL